jgi:hypothetical protein
MLSQLLLAAILAAPVPITGTPSGADATGAYSIALDIEAMPVYVKRGTEWEGDYVYQLPANVRVRRVLSFIGVGRGDVWEGHLHVVAYQPTSPAGFYLHSRGPHKERLGEYDAWRMEPTSYAAGPDGATIGVHALCRPTLARAIECHVGVILEVEPWPAPALDR